MMFLLKFEVKTDFLTRDNIVLRVSLLLYVCPKEIFKFSVFSGNPFKDWPTQITVLYFGSWFIRSCDLVSYWGQFSSNFYLGHRLHENHCSYFLPQQMRTTQNNENGQVGKQQFQSARGTGVLLISEFYWIFAIAAFNKPTLHMQNFKEAFLVGNKTLTKHWLSDSIREKKRKTFSAQKTTILVCTDTGFCSVVQVFLIQIKGRKPR